MKRSDIIPFIIVSMLLFVACFNLLPVVYLLLLTFLLLMCGALIYCYPLKGSIWTSVTLLILFMTFSVYQVHYLAVTNVISKSVNYDWTAIVFLAAIAWLVAASVELLHWAYSILHKMNKPHKPATH